MQGCRSDARIGPIGRGLAFPGPIRYPFGMVRSAALGRRQLLLGSSGLALGMLLAGRAFAADLITVASPAQPQQNRAPLAPQPLLPLPTGSIRPVGWLKRQLQIQARGLGGRLDEFWPDVGPNSGWLGGSGESWERGPYFLDGLLPLAWALDDPLLKAKAQRFIEWTLSSQRPDGMFGPAGNDDWWPRMVMLKALIQYHDLTGDPRVMPLMTAYFHHQLEALPARPLKDWGRFRWQDQLMAMIWLYNRTGDGRLIALARLLKEQGWDWQGMFADFPFKEKVRPEQIGLVLRPQGDIGGTGDPALSAHGVNNAMGIKAAPVWSLVSGERQDRDAVFHQLAELDRYHGMPTGMFAADEHLAGRSPAQGVELCTVVETLFSLEQALAITGDARLADRIERIAFNALPAAFTDDMWSHQYDQQPNQIRCGIQHGPWTTNGDQANMFGLEPHFGCCTANFHQGWPKLLGSLWMATAAGGLAAVIHAPSIVTTSVREVPITIEAETDYPFRSTITYRLRPLQPVEFPLMLRVPGWADGHIVRVNGRVVEAAVQDGFIMLSRTWRPGDTVSLAIAHRPVATAGYHGSLSVADGPLVFVLPIGERWTKLRQRGLSADWRTDPASPWNYGLARTATFLRGEVPVPPVPFDRRAPAAWLTTTGQRVPAWAAEGAYAAPPPAAPVMAEPEQVTLRLVPYGATKLRITSFPGIA